MKKSKARSDGHLTGMRGVYLVAAELAKCGLIASLTSRSAIGADILVTDRNCQTAYSVQVKTNGRRRGFWLVNEKTETISSRNLLYVFVNLRGDDRPDFYVVPSRIVAELRTRHPRATGSVWYGFKRDDAERFKEAWHKFKIRPAPSTPPAKIVLAQSTMRPRRAARRATYKGQ